MDIRKLQVDHTQGSELCSADPGEEIPFLWVRGGMEVWSVSSRQKPPGLVLLSEIQDDDDAEWGKVDQIDSVSYFFLESIS